MKHTEYKTITITTNEKQPDFSLAKKLSEQRAAEIIKGPMLIAWYDGLKQEEHPAVPECQHKPGWLAYADGHNGCLRINVNDNDYSFIFSESGITDD